MKLLRAFLLFFSFAVVACAESNEKPIRAVGKIGLEVFPGRPNFESIKEGDEPEQAWILTVESAKKKEEFQLVVLDSFEQKFAILRKCLGKKVVVEGSVWEACSPHHHTAFLITVKTIKEEPS